MPESQQTMSGDGAGYVVRQLTSLAPLIVPDRRAHLQSLADAVRDPSSGEGPAWAKVDLFEAFEPDTTVLERTNFWSLASIYALFLPLLVTWLGLALAVSRYNSLPDSERAERSFFEVWVTGVDVGFFGLQTRITLGALALLVTLVLLVAIIAGVLADRYNKALDRHRNALRAALTSTSRLLNRRYPTSTADASNALVAFADRLESVAEGLASLVGEVSASAQHAMDELARQASKTSQDVSTAQVGMLQHHAQVVGQMETAIAHATEGMQQAAIAAQSLAASTELDRRRRDQHDRIASHMADTAADLRQQLGAMLDAVTAQPTTGGPGDGAGK